MGTQDSAEVVTEVGVAFWKGKLTAASEICFLHIQPCLAFLTKFHVVSTSRLCIWRSNTLHSTSWLWSTDI